MYVIMKTKFPLGYHHNGFMATMHVHHVPKCMSCYKAVAVITRRVHCFHDYIYIYSAYTYFYIYKIYVIHKYIYIIYIYIYRQIDRQIDRQIQIYIQRQIDIDIYRYRYISTQNKVQIDKYMINMCQCAKCVVKCMQLNKVVIKNNVHRKYVST